MNPFIGFPFERLRFEYGKRERKLGEIKEDQRRCDDEYYEHIYDNVLGRQAQALSDWHRDNSAKFEKETAALEQELKQIEEAMNASST